MQKRREYYIIKSSKERDTRYRKPSGNGKRKVNKKTEKEVDSTENISFACMINFIRQEEKPIHRCEKPFLRWWINAKAWMKPQEKIKTSLNNMPIVRYKLQRKINRISHMTWAYGSSDGKIFHYSFITYSRMEQIMQRKSEDRWGWVAEGKGENFI